MKANIPALLTGVKTNVPLAPYTTFKIGGAARYFFVAKNTKDVAAAVSVAKKCKIPFFILAGGSNILVSDKGFAGIVIKMENTKYQIQNTRVYAQAGVDFSVLVDKTGKRGLSGLEWAGGLPGSVGGAVRGNAGAFGGEVKDNIVFVETMDKQGKIKKLTNKQCMFSYRSSVFKEKNWIVLAVAFALRRASKKRIQAIAKEHIQYRKDKHPLEYPNAGSVFKNCDVRKFSKKLQQELSHVLKADPFFVVPTAYLIFQAGLKGLRVGKAQVSTKHPNYMINLGGASAQDVLYLIEKVKKDVQKKFSVGIEQEIQYIS